MPKPPMNVWSALVVLAIIAGGAAAFLRSVDEVGRAIAAPAQDRDWPSVAQLERALGRRLAVPGFYPKSLRWPPSLVRTSGAEPRVAVLGFVASEGGPERLFLAQTLDGEGELAPALLPPATALDTQPVHLGAGQATFSRLLGADGATWHQVAWARDGRSLVLRSRGSAEELFKLADSVRREGP